VKRREPGRSRVSRSATWSVQAWEVVGKSARGAWTGVESGGGGKEVKKEAIL
jgi:hypothetical protein